MDNDSNSGWKLLSRVVTVAAVTSAVVATGLDYLTRSRATEVRLLELGVQILQEEPQGQNEALRQWGIQLLQDNTKKDLPEGLAESLRDSVSLPARIQWSAEGSAVTAGPKGIVIGVKKGETTTVRAEVSGAGVADTAVVRVKGDSATR